MAFPRLLAWTLLVAVGFGLVIRSARAQDQPLPRKDSQAVDAVTTYFAPETRGIPSADIPTAKKHFLAFARYYGEMIKHPLIYRAAQDPSLKGPGGVPIPPLEGVNGIFNDLHRFIVEPSFKKRPIVDKDKGDYIREFGIAFDTVLKPIINENPEKIVRINATRMLAEACKTGATAFYPTVTALLTNKNTPPYVKYYGLAAAQNLLAAYDVYDVKSRRHSNGWKNEQKKGSGDKELADLVTAIEKHIVDPTAILNDVPNFKVAEATPDQRDVIRFIRRQAIRALAEIRFVAIPTGDGKSLLYPAHTLARVCVSDSDLGVAPSPSECAEAAIGICNMSRIRDGDIQKDYEPVTAVEAVTTAMVTFAGPRAANQNDNSLEWRSYGLRLDEAFKTWRMLFDFGYNPLQPNSFNGSVPPEVDSFVQRMQTELLAPLEKGQGRVAIEEMNGYLKTLRAKADRKPLFSSNPATALEPRNRK